MDNFTGRNEPTPPAPLSTAQITEYLDFEGTTLIARREEVAAALKSNIADHPSIDDDEVLGKIAENVRMAKALARTAGERREQHKKPFLEGGRTVDGWFKRWSIPLDAALKPIQDAMDSYGERKLARERALAIAERDRQQAEADRLAEQASAQLRKGADASDTLDRMSQSAAAVEDADALANARPAELTRSYGTFGAVASARQKWEWRLTDITKVPRKYLKLDEDAIKRAVQDNRDASGKPTLTIPGIAFVAKTRMGVR